MKLPFFFFLVFGKLLCLRTVFLCCLVDFAVEREGVFRLTNWEGRCWSGTAFQVFSRKPDCICSPAFVYCYLLTKSGAPGQTLDPAYAWVVIGDGAFTYYPLPIPEFRKLSLFKGTLAEVFVSEECEVHYS